MYVEVFFMYEFLKKIRLSELVGFFLVSLVLVLLMYLLWWIMGYGYLKGINAVGMMDVFAFAVVFLVLFFIKKYVKNLDLPNNIYWSLLIGFMFVFWFEINIVNYIFFSTFCFLVIEILKVRLEWAFGFCFGFVFWWRILDFVLWNDQLIVTLVTPGAKIVGILMFLLMYRMLKKFKII